MSDKSPCLENRLSRRARFAGIVGNGRTCALIDAHGSIGWMCLPTFAHFPILASLLDPAHGGCFELGIISGDEALWLSESDGCNQHYLPGTNVLETSCAIGDCHIIIQDAMPRGQDCLIRDIRFEPRNSLTHLIVRVKPTSPTPPHARFLIMPNGIAIEETRCVARGRLACDSENARRTLRTISKHEIIYEFTPRENHVTLVLCYEDQLNARRASHSSDQASITRDTRWLDRAVRLDLPDQSLGNIYDRSLLALHLLTYQPTGAILAAPTTSFPSEPGGQRNWDYRYCWVRDGCYAARAFDRAGCYQEAERLYRFVLDRESGGQWPSPLWAIEPGFPTAEEEVPGLCGPGGEKPIRIGNAATLQDQHDSPGNVIAGVYDHTILTGSTDLAKRNWQNIVRAADWCCEHWSESEAGIWEKRDRNRAWVYGRALCWVALRDALRLSKLLGVPSPSRWETTLSDIARQLPDAAWSNARGAFLRVCGEPSVYDSSVLALVLEDLIPAEDARIQCTVRALENHLSYRAAFRRDEESVRPPFYLSTLWMIRALQRIGEYDRAYEYLRSVVVGATDLGLMAEYFDPVTGQQYGNFPQSFSHAEFVRAVNEMLWRLDNERLVLFPAIPSDWLTPGNTITVSNLPLGGKRATIQLKVSNDVLYFTTFTTGRFQAFVPPRYFALNKGVRLNSIS